MRILQRFADNENPLSLASQMRRKRFEQLRPLLSFKTGPISLIDIGGTAEFWSNSILDSFPLLNVTVVNLFPIEAKHPQVSTLVADGRNLSMVDNNSFDIAFSNSVIEHLPCEADQIDFAKELMRVATYYYAQTPNYYFPLEPHFLFPGFQFLPFTARVWLVQNFDLGWVKKVPDLTEAQNVVRHVRLLTPTKFQSFFPRSKLLRERFFGLTKSITATNFDGY